MFSTFDDKALARLNKYIEYLERTFLEDAVPGAFSMRDILAEKQTFFTIQGLADFWSARPNIHFAQYFTDLATGAHHQSFEELTLILQGSPAGLALYLSLGDEETTRSMLEGILPGIVLALTPAWPLLDSLPEHLTTAGLLTGIPSRKPGELLVENEQEETNGQQQRADARGISQLERVIRGMYGATWAYIVQAHPRPRRKVMQARLEIIDALAKVHSLSRFQWQSTNQGNQQITQTESSSQTQTYSGEMINYRAQYVVRLLEHELKRLDRAGSAGQWNVMTYFGASRPDDARRLASLLVGTLAGPDSRPDPLRALLCQPGGSVSLNSLSTCLTSDELATLIQLPREEAPGYAIHDFVSFDVDFRPATDEVLTIGSIQQQNRDTQRTYDISLDALAKHAVVVGVTGSGKTTTVMNLLDHMADAQKPFLVIEPAKTEYRALRNSLRERADVRVYTLGNEMIAPFRLNPFEFETTDDPANAALLTHIDFLKAVFNAAFILYAPMPHVLETALHEVYEDKGWDIASGANIRVPDWHERHRYPIFPTLTDLYQKVELVTNRLGYHEEIERNVKAGLKARIGSLRLGSKGLMLDTLRGIPMQELLSSPVILEMESIGNDDEKTFIMGLFLSRLYEYRRCQAASGQLPAGLQHVLVFEEAHRLLKNTSTQVDTESSNMRAQAIEVFTNMLSEVRAYGQGVLVSEQIPSKLAPDVLKNTNLKIVHRLIARDDRESIGQTMNLNHDQVTHLGILEPGMAAVYAEGADHAYLVRLHNYKHALAPITDSQLKQISSLYISLGFSQPIPDLADYGFALSPSGTPDMTIYQATLKLIDTEKSAWLWGNILLRVLFSSERLAEMLRRLPEYIESELSYLSPDRQSEVLRMCIVLGSAHILHQYGAQFGWSYAQVEQMRQLLTRGLLNLLKKQNLVMVMSDLSQFTRLYQYAMRREQGPFAGCIHCRAKCLYRPVIHVLLSPKDIQRIDQELVSTDYETEEEHYQTVARSVARIAQRWLGNAVPAVQGVGYCLALHAITRSDFTEYEQAYVGDMLEPLLPGRKPFPSQD